MDPWQLSLGYEDQFYHDVVPVALVVFCSVDIINLAPFLVLFLQYWHDIFDSVVVFLIGLLWDQLFDETLMAIN